jgi:hypothetical protein
LDTDYLRIPLQSHTDSADSLLLAFPEL